MMQLLEPLSGLILGRCRDRHGGKLEPPEAPTSGEDDASVEFGVGRWWRARGVQKFDARRVRRSARGQ